MELHKQQGKLESQNKNGINKSAQEKSPALDEIPNDRSHMHHATSDLGALLHIIKSSLGTGILVMPFAFKNAGLLVGLFGCWFTGLLVTHTTAILINSAQGLCHIFNKNSMSYADTAEYAILQSFGGKMKNHAYKVRYATNFFLFVTYYGANICYVLLIAETLQQVVNEYTGTYFSLRVYTLGLILLIYPIGIVRLMKYLVPFSAIANLLLLSSLFVIFREIFTDLPSVDSRPAAKEITRWPIFISTVFVSMEGIGTIMPVENEMRNPKHLTHPPGLVFIGMTLVVFLNTAVGFFGYLKYGDNARAAISLNLPVDWLSQIVKLCVALSVLFTFGLQLSVSVKVMWDGMQKLVDNPTMKHYYLLRSIMIVGIVILATAIPSLGGVFSLLGSIGFSMIGVCIPAVIEIAYYSENYGCFNWRLIKNVFLILFGLLVAAVGTYCNVYDIFQTEM